MNLLWIIILSIHLISALDDVADKEERISLKKFKTTQDRIRTYGYPVETHIIETTDGYLLNVFRIPYSHKLQNENKHRPAILLQHGLESNSDCWISNGPDNSLAYLLADQGYDVWLGNDRGNIYSRNNTKISLKHAYFWRFSFHEMGIIDIPTMIDYILIETGETKIHYVGHSQGTIVYFIMASMRPEYNEKIKTAHMLAPCAFFQYADAPVFRLFKPLIGTPSNTVNILQDQELLPQNKLFNRLIDTSCAVFNNTFCRNMYVGIAGSGYQNTNITSFEQLLETHPGGASTNQGIHFIQLSVSGGFRQYDWGVKKNMKLYGQQTPPDYDLSKITAPTYLYSSKNDALCVQKDVDTLVTKIPNVIDYRIPDATWNHLDFIIARQIKEVVNEPIINHCNEYEQRSFKQF